MRILGFFLGILMTTSCLKTEVINATEEHEAVVEKRRKPEPMPEKPEHNDTTRMPMGWNPSVENWTETNVEL